MMPIIDYDQPDDTEERGTPARLKLWELSPAYRCSVIGTCLSVSELRKLSRKAGLNRLEKADDASLHAKLVKITGKKVRLATLTQRTLDRKFRDVVNRLTSARAIGELHTRWSEDASAENLAGLLWGVITHPLCTADLQRQAHTEVHMMAHLALQATLRGVSHAGDLEEKVTKLEEELQSSRQGYRRAISERDEKIRKQAEQLDQLRRLRSQLDEAERRVTAAEAYDCDEELLSEVDRVRAARQEDRDRATEAESELGQLRKELSKLRRHDTRQQQELEELKAIQRETTAELEELHVGGAADPCVDCRTGPCPGARLCGRRILYVGGRAHLIRFYRETVERRGGEFLHHDGGVEQNLARLQGLMDSVDAVMVATDHVSHRAALSVKQACKTRSKPFLPLRNSSLSTLAQGLEELESEHFPLEASNKGR